MSTQQLPVPEKGITSHSSHRAQQLGHLLVIAPPRVVVYVGLGIFVLGVVAMVLTRLDDFRAYEQLAFIPLGIGMLLGGVGAVAGAGLKRAVFDKHAGTLTIGREHAAILGEISAVQLRCLGWFHPSRGAPYVGFALQLRRATESGDVTLLQSGGEERLRQLGQQIATFLELPFEEVGDRPS